MIKLRVFVSESLDVYHNQAIEKYFLDRIEDDEVILYLWQNDRTIVIGANQDAYGECDIEKLEKDGGHLARRMTGGGAVYHDKGNLNFTFITPKALYDLSKQEEVILKALDCLGIKAAKTGRNDLVIDGRKFSGHAYYKGKWSCLHHGTLMLEVDEGRLQDYLRVSLAKLHSKNVASVRSRIINLKSVREDLDLDSLKKALIHSAELIYETEAEPYTAFDQDELTKLEAQFKDGKWRYGKLYKEGRVIEKRFDFGTVRIVYVMEEDQIKDLSVFTDALDTDLFDGLEKRLIGKRINEIDTEKENKESKAVIESLKEDFNEI
ncbi:MAG: lipoate--protein ligase [Erysipelotrichaceae bacterium]|nr:lipoate--protein ligase [Erysipelotrichaceae bacterium]